MLDYNRADFYYKKVSLKLIEEEIQCQPKYCWCFSHPFVDDDWYIASSAALGRANIAVEIWLAQVFSCEFCEISKNILFIEHLRETASEVEN